MLKCHVQISGCSLHAQEIQINNIRTKSTNDSVCCAVAIQMIINKELGLNVNENPWQGSFAADSLTILVDKAVYKEFEAISERGGVLGAMDTMYQRGKIPEESLYDEQKKHDGSLQLLGVNTFLGTDHGGEITAIIAFIRSTEDEKGQQIINVRAYQTAPNGGASDGLKPLQHTVRKRENLFAVLVEAVKTQSLGQLSYALYQVSGEYRNM